jgi:predicted component of type VI protein secretion system
MKSLILTLLLFISLLILYTGCSASRKSEPQKGPLFEILY